MADAERRARLIIEAKDAVTSEARKAGDALGGFKNKLADLNQAAGQLVKSFIGPAALVGAFKFSIDAAMEAQRVMTQTEAVIKSTGGAAGLTANQIEQMALKESRLTSIDDEVIQSGQNMLLTFTKVGSETFPRATRAMEDMAVAFAKGDTSAIDLQGTAIQLGKALSDPEKGLLALRRVGVTFSESQKAVIKDMVAMNDVAGAQAVILKELEKEFGGSAEAAGNNLAGKLQKAKNAIENLGEAIGGKLIPVLGDAADAFTIIISGSEQISNALNEHQAEVRKTATGYEAYITEMKRAAAVTGQQIDANGNLIISTRGMAGEVQHVTQDHFALTKAQYEATQGAYGLSGALDETSRILGRTAVATKDVTQEAESLKVAEEEAKNALDALKFTMSGIVTKEMKDYNKETDKLKGKQAELIEQLGKLEAADGRAVTSKSKHTLSANELTLAQLKLADAQTKLSEATDPMKQATLAVQIDNLTEKIGGAEVATTSYINNSKKIGEVKDSLGEVNAALDENVAAHDKATKQILFDIAAQQLAQMQLSGSITSEQEIKALTTLAEKWGLIDEATATATKNVLAATLNLANDGSVDAFASNMTTAFGTAVNGADMAGDAFDRARGRAQEMAGTYTIDVITRYTNEGAPPSDASDRPRTGTPTPRTTPTPPPRRGNQRQFGGSVAGGASYLVGEGGAEMFVPNTAGFMMDNTDTRKMIQLLQAIAAGIGNMGQINVNAGGVDVNSIVNGINVALGRRARQARVSGAGMIGQ